VAAAAGALAAGALLVAVPDEDDEPLDGAAAGRASRVGRE
jgi:hypothetical protein